MADALAILCQVVSLHDAQVLAYGDRLRHVVQVGRFVAFDPGTSMATVELDYWTH